MKTRSSPLWALSRRKPLAARKDEDGQRRAWKPSNQTEILTDRRPEDARDDESCGLRAAAAAPGVERCRGVYVAGKKFHPFIGHVACRKPLYTTNGIVQQPNGCPLEDREPRYTVKQGLKVELCKCIGRTAAVGVGCTHIKLASAPQGSRAALLLALLRALVCDGHHRASRDASAGQG